MVDDGTVRWQDKDGNEAADWGRRRQPEHVMDARRRIQNASSFWFSIFRDLHLFFIAVARKAVKNDGKGSRMVQWSFDQKSQKQSGLVPWSYG